MSIKWVIALLAALMASCATAPPTEFDLIDNNFSTSRFSELT